MLHTNACVPYLNLNGAARAPSTRLYLFYWATAANQKAFINGKKVRGFFIVACFGVLGLGVGFFFIKRGVCS